MRHEDRPGRKATQHNPTHTHHGPRSKPDQPALPPQSFAMIEALVVAEGYQHKGIGTALLREARFWSKHGNLDSIQRMVWEENSAAIAFYEQFGFTTQMRRMAITTT